MKRWAKITALTLYCGVLGGCVQTTYKQYNAGPAEQNTVTERLVKYQVTKEYYRNPPDCVVILPAKGQVNSRSRSLIELAAARHLRSKIGRVIGPEERRVLARRLAVDLSSSSDRKVFANTRFRNGACRFFATPIIYGVEENFALIWAGRKVHLGIEINGAKNDVLLWKADHSTKRGDGGLPLSPFSLGSAAFRASQLNGDKDMLPSMIDDVYRRIVVTLPDTRSY